MHTGTIFEWDNDPKIHGILIGANLLLLLSLIMRFEWPLIKKRFKSSDENHIKNNIKHNEISLTNINNNINTNGDLLKERSLPLSGLPDGSKIPQIQLTKISADTNIEIEEEKYAYSQLQFEEKEKEKNKEKEKKKDKDKDERKDRKRRKASIEFYGELFNIHYNEIDNRDVKYSKKRINRRRDRGRNNNNNNNNRKINRRNDSMNLRAHQKTSLDIDNIDDDISIDISIDDNIDILIDDNIDISIDDRYGIQNNNINNGIISVRFRYRYILYLPLIIFILSGVINIIIDFEKNDIEKEYFFINYGYPIFSIILSIVLWFEIDIVILSCGGSHIVEECLEVQISANGHEYKCIYCCWCDLSILKFCNCCTMDNGYSLFKCHHKFMKILICLICPLLTIVFFIISEFKQINEQLINIKINDIINMNHIYNNITLYYLIFVIISILYLILIFTATYIGILIVKSLYFVSSLNTKTLILQYINSIILTFVMQIQFIILLVYYNIIIDQNVNDGLCIPTSFYMILVYIEFIIASILNHFAFQNIDFNKFGKEAIEKNKVQLFDFKPDFNNIHDLHNYRRVYGDKFLLQTETQTQKETETQIQTQLQSQSQPQTQSQTQQQTQQQTQTQTQQQTQTQTQQQTQTQTQQQTQTQTQTQCRTDISNIKLESVLLNPVKDNENIGINNNSLTLTHTTNKETKHNYPHTNTHSLSLDLTSQYSSSTSSSSYTIKKKIKRIDSEIP